MALCEVGISIDKYRMDNFRSLGTKATTDESVPQMPR